MYYSYTKQKSQENFVMVKTTTINKIKAILFMIQCNMQEYIYEEKN